MNPSVLLITETPPGTPNGFGVTLNTLLSDHREKLTVFYTDAAFLEAGEKQGYILARVPNHRGRRHWLRFQAGRIPEWHGRFSRKWLRRTLKGRRPDLTYSMVYSYECLRFADWVSRQLLIPHLLHVADYSKCFLSTRGAKALFRRASARFTIGDNMRKCFEKHFYDLPFQVLRNGPEESDFLPEPKPASFHADRPFRLCFIGGLFKELHGDGVEDFIEAVRRLRKRGIPIRLDFYGARHPADFPQGLTEEPGIRHHGIVMPLDKRRDLLREADASIVPASFDASNAALYKYSFPTKLTELLASRRPTLVYAPENMESVQFCLGENLGAVLTNRSIDSLSSALLDLLENYSHHLGKATADAKVIRSHHSAAEMRKRFSAAVDHSMAEKPAA